AAIELETRPHGMNAAHVVQVRLEVERPAVAAATDLLTTERELTDDPDRRPLEDRARAAVGPAERGPRVDEEAAAQRAGLLDAQRIPMILGGVAALLGVVTADAEVEGLRLVAAVVDPQCLVAGQRIVEQTI